MPYSPGSKALRRGPLGDSAWLRYRGWAARAGLIGDLWLLGHLGRCVGSVPESRDADRLFLLGREVEAAPPARHDGLGVRAGLRAPVDGAEDDPIALGVQQGQGERQLPGHLLQRVVADDRHVP